MAINYKLVVDRDRYPTVRNICDGGLPESYDTWIYENEQSSRHSIGIGDVTKWVELDLNEFRAYCQRTRYKGQTALDNFAFEKGNALERDG